MEFDYQGARVRLHGMKTPSATATSTVALKLHVPGQIESQYFHLSVFVDVCQETKLFPSCIHADASAPSDFVDQLHSLLTEYTDIFLCTQGYHPADRSTIEFHYNRWLLL